MAPFVPELNPTNDPNYLGQSRGYSKSDVPTDTSLGKLFDGIGDIVVPAVKAVDTKLQIDARKALEDEINPIRNAAGANLTPEEVVPIAGKGGRGTRYAVAASPDDLAMENAAPQGVTKSVDSMKRMKSAYDAGLLSDSYYYAQLNTAVSKVKAQFPGYGQEIDSMVSSITGVNPANALRTSIKNDLASASAASQAAARRIDTRYHQDAEYIQLRFPGMTVQEYGARQQAVDIEVGKMKARDYDIKSRSAALEFANKNDARTAQTAERVYQDKVNGIVSDFVAGTVNDLQKRSETLLSQGTSAKPEEMDALTRDWQMAQSRLRLAFNRAAIDPIGEGSSKSLSTFVEPGKREAINKQALEALQPIIDNIGVKETGVASSTANVIKNRHNQDILAIERKFPITRLITGLRGSVGDAAMPVVIERTKLLPEIDRAIADMSWMSVANVNSGPPMTVSEALDNFTGGASPTATRTVVQNYIEMTKSKNPEVVARAVSGLYNDPKFFANLPNSDKKAVFSVMVSPDMSARAKAAGGEVYEMYSTWVDQAFGTVFKQNIDDLQYGVQEAGVTVTFQPKSLRFETKAPSATGGRPGTNNPGAFYGNSINGALALVAPVWRDRYGDQADEHLLEVLQDYGYNPNAPKSSGFLKRLGDAVRDVTKEKENIGVDKKLKPGKGGPAE